MKEQNKKEVFVPKKIWNSNFIRIMFVSTMFFTLNQISMVAFPLFLTDLKASPAIIGMSTSLLTLFAMLSRPIVGSMTDKKGRRFVMIMGLAVFTASFLGYAAIAVVSLAMVFRAASGFGISAASTANMTIAADVLPPTKITKGLAYFGLCETVASAVGPTLALALILGSNYLPVWLTSVGFGIAAIMIVFTFTYEKRMPPRVVDESQEKVSFLWRFLEKPAFFPSLVQAITVFAASGVMAFLAPYAREAGIENIGVFYAVQACAMCVVRIAVGKLLIKVRSPFLILIPAAICEALAFVFISIMTDLTTMIAGAVLYGVGIGLFMATISVIVMSSATPERRGAASSTFYIMCDIGACVGGIVGGQIANYLGYSQLFLLYAILPFIALTIGFFVFKKRKNRV